MVHKSVLLCALFALYLSASYPQDKAPFPSKILNSKTIFLVNDLGDSKALDALYSALKHWGRYQIVQEREKADLLIVMTENEQYAGFVTTANVTSSGTSAHGTGMAIPIQGRKFFLRLLDGTSGESLWTESRLMYWTPSKTAKLLVERIRKRAQGK